MESIVKMGVSGKNTYGKNEQRAGADIYSPPNRRGRRNRNALLLRNGFSRTSAAGITA